MTRLYIVDIVQTGIYRNLDHFGGRGLEPDAALVDVRWARMDYGLINQALVAANVDAVQQAYLELLPDVVSIPENLDTLVTAITRPIIETALEARTIPATWVSVGDSYRVVLREIAGYFQYMQGLTAIMGIDPTTLGVSLGTQYGNLPQSWQNGIVQAAQALGYNTAGLQSTTTIRAILRGIAAQSGNKIYIMGDFSL